MRNLKKILALVLALVMSFSLVSVASAKDFSDAEDINYDEAVAYLTALKVFTGYADGSFKPQGEITRAEVAALIYRIDTVDVNDIQKDIYSDYNKFDDVTSKNWFAGYVNYCANAEFVKGRNDSTFDPNGKVTGYEVLAMILRVVGYDQHNEFSGSEWKLNVAKYAQNLGIIENVTAETLGAPATRELVAELLWRTITEVDQVIDIPALGYSPVDLKGKELGTIEEEKIGLYTVTGNDDWGFPVATVMAKYWPTTKGSTLFDKSPAYLHFTTDVMDHCCIASELGIKGGSKTMKLFNNGVESEIIIDSLSTVKKLGEQGTEMYIYEDRIVLRDTYLAEVTATQKLVTDKAGHIKQEPKATFTIYKSLLSTKSDVVANDGDVYAKGDFMLYYFNDKTNKAEMVGAPTVITDKQTVMWWNAEKHTIGDTLYPDNINFVVDEAGYDNATAHYWFIDQHGYVIGAKDVPAAPVAPDTYAVVLGAQWINAIGEAGYALINLQYLDGTTETVKLLAIDEIFVPKYADAYETDFQTGKISTTYQNNDDTDEHLYIVKAVEGGVKLTTVTNHYGAGSDDEITVTLTDGYSNIAGTPVNCNNYTKYFYVYKGALMSVTGFDSFEQIDCKYITADSMDVVLNKDTGFAEYVYLYSPEFTKDAPVVTPVVDTEEFIFFTGGALSLYEYTIDKVEYFMVYGAVNAKGEVTPLYFEKGEDADATLRNLMANMAVWENKLCIVTHVKNAVKNVAIIGDIATLKDMTAERVAAGQFEYLADSGVLELADGRKLNVNGSTTMIIENHVGNQTDLVEAAEHDIYIVYTANNFVKTVFIVPHINGLA